MTITKNAIATFDELDSYNEELGCYSWFAEEEKALDYLSALADDYSGPFYMLTIQENEAGLCTGFIDRKEVFPD